MICPECHGHGLIAETRRRRNGDVRRRWRCSVCDHRWTVINGSAPTTGPPPIRLSDQAIADMLISADIHRVVGARHGCSHSTVKRIRYGELHAKALPMVPRWRNGKPQATAADLPKLSPVDADPGAPRGARMSCLICIQYSGDPSKPCSLGHPDPLEEGFGFAQDCSTYIPIND